MTNKAIVLAPWTVWIPGREEPDDISSHADKFRLLPKYSFSMMRARWFDDAYVEILHPQQYPEFEMIVDEDGEPKQLPVNGIASKIYGDIIVGPAVLLPKGTIK